MLARNSDLWENFSVIARAMRNPMLLYCSSSERILCLFGKSFRNPCHATALNVFPQHNSTPNNSNDDMLLDEIRNCLKIAWTCNSIVVCAFGEKLEDPGMATLSRERSGM